VDKFDRKLTRRDIGVRAVWLLYKRGKWGYLEDFGIDRAVAGPAFERFEAENAVGRRLTKSQVKKLAKIPGVLEAGMELRLAYTLKSYSQARGAKAMTRYYHGEVHAENVAVSDQVAERVAKEYAGQVTDLKGTITVGRNFGDAPAVLIVTLPDDVTVDPGELVPGVTFTQVFASQVPQVEDRGIRE
jgi:hypothetical protein